MGVPRYLFGFALVCQSIMSMSASSAEFLKKPALILDCVVPDNYRIRKDGDDDAPSITRALAALKAGTRNNLCLMSHVYRIRSPIVQQDIRINWHGQGWTESVESSAGGNWRGQGTWLLIDHAKFRPITITGSGSRGSTVQDLAIAEAQPQDTASPHWVPTDYMYVFNVESTYGMIRFENIMFYGVTAGIMAHEAGRLDLDRIYGQVFNNLVKVDKSYDANRYNAIHIWPYWSQAAGVMSYTQRKLDALWLLRADTGTIDDLFVYGANSAIRLDQSDSESPAMDGGTATKNIIGAVHCDATRWCIWVKGRNVIFQAGSIDSQGQEWTSPRSKPKALSGAAAIRIDGQAVIQVGNVWQEFTDHSTFCFNSTTEASNLQVGSLYEDFRYADDTPNTLTIRNVPDAGHSFSVSMTPMVVSRKSQTVGTGAVGTDAIVHIP